MPKQEEAVAKTKLLLGIQDESKDGILEFIYTDCVNLILGYCRIETLPEKLESLVPAMMAKSYRINGYGAETHKVVASITQGSRSETYEASNANDTNLLNDYIARLKPFVNRRGRVPSDIE